MNDFTQFIREIIEAAKAMASGKPASPTPPSAPLPTATPTAPLKPGERLSKANCQSPIRDSHGCLGAYSRTPYMRQALKKTFDEQGRQVKLELRTHNGVDLSAPGGTAVYPMADGIVERTGYEMPSETSASGRSAPGHNITIKHDDGHTRSKYYHLASFSVKKGDRVTKDTVIGKVGTSGNARQTYPHLHFEVWVDNSHVDPAGFIPVPKYTPVTKEQRQNMWLPGEQEESKKFDIAAPAAAQAAAKAEAESKKRKSANKNIDNVIKSATYFYKLSV